MSAITRLSNKQTYMVRNAARQIFREGVAKKGSKNNYKKPFNSRPNWGAVFKLKDFNVSEPHNPTNQDGDQSLAHMYAKKFDRMLIDATQYISDYQTPKR